MGGGGGIPYVSRIPILGPLLDMTPIGIVANAINPPKPPVDCEGSYANWTPCSTGNCGETGTSTAEFIVSVSPKRGGAECPSPVTETCYGPPCPIHCVYQTGQWSPCTASCGGGTQRRSTVITTPAQYGGSSCPPQSETISCNTQPCPVPCEGRWSDWVECNKPCGGGLKSRTFTVTKPAAYGGTACPYPLTQREACNTQPCPINCEGVWGEWSDCSKACGTGTQYRNFTVTTPAQYGGTACPVTPETQDCNTDPCLFTTSLPDDKATPTDKLTYEYEEGSIPAKIVKLRENLPEFLIPYIPASVEEFNNDNQKKIGVGVSTVSLTSCFVLLIVLIFTMKTKRRYKY